MIYLKQMKFMNRPFFIPLLRRHSLGLALAVVNDWLSFLFVISLGHYDAKLQITVLHLFRFLSVISSYDVSLLIVKFEILMKVPFNFCQWISCELKSCNCPKIYYINVKAEKWHFSGKPSTWVRTSQTQRSNLIFFCIF